jgi:hypothetical protein
MLVKKLTKKCWIFSHLAYTQDKPTLIRTKKAQSYKYKLEK